MSKASAAIVAALTVAMPPASLLVMSTRAVAATARPNILLIVVDDMGYSDTGAFGGEIATPHIDALARRGAQLTEFYVGPTCSPTRAMLLTGRDNHEVGVGAMAEFRLPIQRGNPAYAGVLNRRSATLAERLRDAGYDTMMTGKWHLGQAPDQNPAQRGFAHSFALLGGAHNHFGMDQTPDYAMLDEAPRYTSDGKPTVYPVGRDSADFFTDKMLTYLKTAPRDRPFFAYLALTEPHSPLQAPRPDIVAQHGNYDAGPAALRDQRLARMRALGIISQGMTAYPPQMADWKGLTSADRALQARRMEAYAAMVTRIDANVGRVMAALEASGQLKNTVVLFLSDNGPDGVPQNAPGTLKDDGARSAGVPPLAPIKVPYDNELANIGEGTSFVSNGPEWAQALSAPYRGFKGMLTSGGTHSSAIIAGPGIKQERISDLADVTDVVPTLLAFADVPAATEVAGRPTLAPSGKSWRARLAGGDVPVRTDADAVFREFYLQRSVRVGRYKALFLPPPPVRPAGTEAAPPAATGPTRWQLYDLVADPGETRDLAAEKPDILASLIARWSSYAGAVGIAVPPEDPMRGK